MLHAYREANITFLRAPVLERIPHVVHGFSTRQSGDARLTIESSSSQLTDARTRFLSAIGLAGWPIGALRQVHSSIIHAVHDKEFANDSPEGDAAYTKLTGFALSVVTADCVPVLVADSEGRAVAAVHAGWRGTSEGILRKTVESLTASCDVEAKDLYVAIGPHIGTCCMEVGEEVFGWFADSEVFERRPEWRKPHLDLARANRKQLVGVGVLPERIQVSALCTRCRSDLFHSYRRDGGTAGRMLSVIGIAP
jgi:YfiH family protein